MNSSAVSLEQANMLQSFLSMVSSIEDTMYFYGTNMDGELDWSKARDDMLGSFECYVYSRRNPDLKSFGYSLLELFEIAEAAGLTYQFRQVRHEEV